MSEEMNNELQNIKNLAKGDIVKGRVAKIENNQAFIDLGYKFDGIIELRDVSNLFVEKIEDVLKVGDEIEAQITEINDDKERLLLSKRVVDALRAWDSLQAKLDNQEVLNVKVMEVVKGGLVVDVGVRGFVPASMVETHFVDDFSDYKGKTLTVKVVELDKEQKRVVLSQRAVLEEEAGRQKQQALEGVQVGAIKEGTVKRLTDFGAFVDIGGIDGLVHVSEMSWDRVTKPSDIVKEGDKVTVKVLKVDPVGERISLSIKETTPSPWDKAKEGIKVGDVYEGKIKRVVSFGAFVEVLPGIEGLVHISQISDDHIERPDQVLQVGQEVKVKVLDVDLKANRISLSIREANDRKKIEEKELKEYQQEESHSFTLGDLIGDKLKDLK